MTDHELLIPIFRTLQPIGNGPVMNKMGRAIVQMLVSGVETQYAIQAQPMDEETVQEETLQGAQ